MKIESANDKVDGGKYKVTGRSQENGLAFPEPSEFDSTLTQTNALLNIKDNQFNLIL